MPRRENYPRHFEVLWKKRWAAVGPLTGDSKKEGFEAYKRELLGGATIKEIHRGVDRYRQERDRLRGEGKWVESPKHLCRFLKQGLYFDWFDRWQEEMAVRRRLIKKRRESAANVTAFPVRRKTRFQEIWDEKKSKEANGG